MVMPKDYAKQEKEVHKQSECVHVLKNMQINRNIHVNTIIKQCRKGGRKGGRETDRLI